MTKELQTGETRIEYVLRVRNSSGETHTENPITPKGLSRRVSNIEATGGTVIGGSVLFWLLEQVSDHDTPEAFQKAVEDVDRVKRLRELKAQHAGIDKEIAALEEASEGGPQ